MLRFVAVRFCRLLWWRAFADKKERGFYQGMLPTSLPCNGNRGEIRAISACIPEPCWTKWGNARRKVLPPPTVISVPSVETPTRIWQLSVDWLGPCTDLGVGDGFWFYFFLFVFSLMSWSVLTAFCLLSGFIGGDGTGEGNVSISCILLSCAFYGCWIKYTLKIHWRLDCILTYCNYRFHGRSPNLRSSFPYAVLRGTRLKTFVQSALLSCVASSFVVTVSDSWIDDVWPHGRNCSVWGIIWSPQGLKCASRVGLIWPKTHILEYKQFRNFSTNLRMKCCVRVIYAAVWLHPVPMSSSVACQVEGAWYIFKERIFGRRIYIA